MLTSWNRLQTPLPWKDLLISPAPYLDLENTTQTFNNHKLFMQPMDLIITTMKLQKKISNCFIQPNSKDDLIIFE